MTVLLIMSCWTTLFIKLESCKGPIIPCVVVLLPPTKVEELSLRHIYSLSMAGTLSVGGLKFTYQIFLCSCYPYFCRGMGIRCPSSSFLSITQRKHNEKPPKVLTFPLIQYHITINLNGSRTTCPIRGTASPSAWRTTKNLVISYNYNKKWLKINKIFMRKSIFQNMNDNNKYSINWIPCSGK